MGIRRSYRPADCEALEERKVMSQGGLTALASHHGAPPPVPFVGPVGSLGDSYSDEYRFYPPDRSTARNWIEILHATRGVAFGHYSLRSRGEPRNQGFADNWSRSDATSVDMVNNQLPGLTTQVAQGKVQYVSIFIGGNDFLHILDDAVAGKIAPAKLPAAVTATTATLEKNFVTAVSTILAANPNVKVVVFNLPDISVIPVTQVAGATPLGKLLLQGVSQAIQSYNKLIGAVAASNDRVALLDLNAVTKQAAGSPTGTLPFGGQTIVLRTPSDDYHSFFLADGIHVGTIGQGIIAEEFALAVDQKFGAQLFPPSPQEVVRYAVAIRKQATAHPNHR